jgi:Tfp pilus assembly protein PilX
MGKSTRDSRGFTLIAALLLTVLLSGLAVGLIFLVTGEQKMGNNDLEGNLAYYGAESGIENLTAQLSALYQSSQSPTSASITALTARRTGRLRLAAPTSKNMNYVENITWPTVQPQWYALSESSWSGASTSLRHVEHCGFGSGSRHGGIADPIQRLRHRYADRRIW